MQKRGIIFDLDGTLWDVTDSTCYAANVIAKKYSLPEVIRETVCNGFGRDKISNAKLYFPNVQINKAVELLSETSKFKNNILKEKGGIIYKNLNEVLDKLKDNYNFYIVSYTSDVEYIEIFLNTSGLKEYFIDYIATGALNMKKHEGIRKIIDLHNIKESVYIGDTEIDKIETSLAGIPFIHAKYGFDKELSSEYYIDNLEQLPIVLNEIFKTN